MTSVLVTCFEVYVFLLSVYVSDTDVHLGLIWVHPDFMFRVILARVRRVGCTLTRLIFLPLPNFVFPPLSWGVTGGMT